LLAPEENIPIAIKSEPSIIVFKKHPLQFEWQRHDVQFEATAGKPYTSISFDSILNLGRKMTSLAKTALVS